MLQNRRKFTLLLLPLLLWGGSALATIGPSEQVEQTVKQVLHVLSDHGLTKAQRRQEVVEIVRPRFDYRAMSQIILARQWRRASPEQRKRFVELFRELLERTYFSAMDSYHGEKVKIGRQRLEGKRAVVQSFVVTSKKKVPVDYKLRLKNDQWFAYDVTVDGVSLVSNYRTSFRNLIREKGMDGLLQELEKKVAKLGAGS